MNKLEREVPIEKWPELTDEEFEQLVGSFESEEEDDKTGSWDILILAILTVVIGCIAFAIVWWIWTFKAAICWVGPPVAVILFLFWAWMNIVTSRIEAEEKREAEELTSAQPGRPFL